MQGSVKSMIAVDGSVLRGGNVVDVHILMHRSPIVSFEQLSGVHDNEVEALLEATCTPHKMNFLFGNNRSHCCFCPSRYLSGLLLLIWIK